MSSNRTTADYRLDHVILIVGGNPLPIVIAADLLTAKEGRVTLLHTKDTLDIAKKIASCIRFRAQSIKIDLIETASAEPSTIRDSVKKIVESSHAERIGLDYTGGTKAMAVNAFAAFSATAPCRDRQTWTTYVSAAEQALVVEPVGESTGLPSFKIPLADRIQFGLRELLDLHAWKIRALPNEQTRLCTTSSALVKQCSTPLGARNFKDWLHNELRTKCMTRSRFLEEHHLKRISLNLAGYPHLNHIFSILKTELGVQANAKQELRLVHAGFNNSATEFCRWLDGVWLEHAVLDALKAARELKMDYIGQSLVTIDPEFEIDIIALKGHKIFAISCTTDAKKYVKQKLFEVYFRAKQLGGDEAQVCLVCCGLEPETIRMELRRQLPSASVHVIGMAQLADLKTHLSDWIKS